MLREAIVSAVAAPVASILTIVMIAGMCAAVLLTSGRTVGAQEAVVGSIDSAGTRSIIIRADPAAGLDTTVLDRIGNLDGIDWAGAFSLATDVQNTAFPGGTRVPLRHAYSADWDELGLPETGTTAGAGDIAYASTTAAEQLGLNEPVGQVATTTGAGYAVAGLIEVPDHLAFLEPVLIAPQPDTTHPEPVGILVVIAERPDLVAPVAAAVTSVLAVEDPTKVTVQTSESLATLRALIEGQLGGYGHALTLGILALTAILVGAILYGIVMLRRKDFGRRRALGASRALIVGLLLTQTALLAAAGAIIGSTIAHVTLAITGDPQPGWEYTLGVATLATAVAVAAALIPALAAARREPIRELRVP
ncbi:ABC transporter permease [Agromyces larvae]|uniref:Lipoprotein ABC transporter permease n=1 Tax=Agromyces larvae TaxID=2929802 RepID=A0ABY4BUJ4_9MICO|nr:FtsX-like permease family protein [Agromyces larvae]UOE42825.1 lipoprotein ABC transporter permease [Agromyces larvae]